MPLTLSLNTNPLVNRFAELSRFDRNHSPRPAYPGFTIDA